jgi:hypothetical protein
VGGENGVRGQFARIYEDGQGSVEVLTCPSGRVNTTPGRRLPEAGGAPVGRIQAIVRRSTIYIVTGNAGRTTTGPSAARQPFYRSVSRSI